MFLNGCREQAKADKQKDVAEQAPASKNQTNQVKTEQKSVRKETDSAEQIKQQIEQKKQSIEDIEAFVQMERAKIEKNPDYDNSFLNEALDEQQEIRDSIKSKKEKLNKADQK